MYVADSPDKLVEKVEQKRSAWCGFGSLLQWDSHTCATRISPFHNTAVAVVHPPRHGAFGLRILRAGDRMLRALDVGSFPGQPRAHNRASVIGRPGGEQRIDHVHFGCLAGTKACVFQEQEHFSAAQLARGVVGTFLFLQVP